MCTDPELSTSVEADTDSEVLDIGMIIIVEKRTFDAFFLARLIDSSCHYTHGIIDCCHAPLQQEEAFH